MGCDIFPYFLYLRSTKEDNHAFPILYYIRLIRWIQLEPVKYDCSLL